MKTMAWLGAIGVMAVCWRLFFATIVIPHLGTIGACIVALTLAGIGIWFFLKGRSERVKAMAIALIISLCPLLYHVL